MVELGQLEGAFAEFEKRQAKIVVVSIEPLEKARLTQRDFPRLLVLSDARRNLAEAAAVIHCRSDPTGGDTFAPTTILLDEHGIVRWLHRSERHIVRLKTDELLRAVDEHLGPGKSDLRTSTSNQVAGQAREETAR